MTVAELIEQLKEMPQDAPMKLGGYDSAELTLVWSLPGDEPEVWVV